MSRLVTLGVPVYNGALHLEATLRSLLGQTYGDIEIVVSDNASTDATADIVEAIARDDGRIRYVRADRNRGAGWNYNRVLGLARGEYFKWAAADDLCAPTFVERCVAVLEAEPDVVLAFPRTIIIDAAGRRLRALDDANLHLPMPEPHRRVGRLLSHRIEWHAIFGVIRRDTLRRTRGIGNFLLADVEVLAELAMLGRFHQVPEPLFLRRYHAGRSVIAHASPADQLRWYDPSSRARLVLPQVTIGRALLSATRTAPLPSAERARCAAAVIRYWALPNWREYGSDAKRAYLALFGHPVHRGRRPIAGRPAGAFRPLVIDPSGRGGIPRYTARVLHGLGIVGAEPTLLGCRTVARRNDGYPVRGWLPRERWGRPPQMRAWPRFYGGRLAAWLVSTAAVSLVVRLERPDVVHFQAPVNRHLDAALLRRVRRHAPVVWTAHDVLPAERTAADERRFASIYRTADLVIVHSETAADEVRRLAGVEPAVVEHVPDDTVRIDRGEARRRLGLPPGERILGALGFIKTYKGYDLLADVWERLGGAAPWVIVVGEVVDDDAWLLLGRLERTGRAIVRAGYASDAEFRLVASAVDALLLPHVSASESGLLHLARAVGIPVLASDAPQLAASVRASSAGAVLPRRIEPWAAAVTGALPPPPCPPPPVVAIGGAHLRAYEEALRRGGRPRG